MHCASTGRHLPLSYPWKTERERWRKTKGVCMHKNRENGLGQRSGKQGKTEWGRRKERRALDVRCWNRCFLFCPHTVVPSASLLCSVHVGKSVDDVAHFSPTSVGYSFILGIGIGAGHPSSCGSVAASEQSEEEGITKNAQHQWFAWLRVRNHL